MATNSIGGEIGSIEQQRAGITLIGCNHRTAPLELRERVSFTPEQATRAAAELCASGVVEEAVVVSTCNRSELYGVALEPHTANSAALAAYFAKFHKLSPEDLNGNMYQHAGPEAVRHLFRVAAGLDSLMLGEAEILGQVREAYGRALGNHSTGPVLNRLFQGALEAGKRVRAETEIGARPVSVALAGVKLAERIFGKLKGHTALILGAGDVAEQVLEQLRLRGIEEVHIVNRSFARAQELSARFGGKAVEWSVLGELFGKPDIVVTSVSAEERVLDRAAIARAMERREGRALFVLDLGMPRNVEPAAENLYNVYLFNLEQLGEIAEQNRKSREAEIPRAEAIIEEHVRKFLAWQSGLEATSLVAALRDRLERERRALLEAHFAGADAALEAERARLEKLTEDLIHRIAQLPAEYFQRERKAKRPIEGLAALRDVFGLSDPGLGDGDDDLKGGEGN